MNSASYSLLFSLAALAETPCLADVDGCSDMAKAASDAALPAIKKAFAIWRAIRCSVY
jgi:hypothetical protein